MQTGEFMATSEKTEYYFFELFCIDPSDIKSEIALAQAISFSNTLWGGNTPAIEHEKGRVRVSDPISKISIIISLADTSKVLTNYFESAFMLKIFSENFDAIESFRIKILKHLKNTLQFNSIRLLSDDVSTYMANKLYPEINKVENLLRKYLIKFFIQRIGSDWWEATATKQMIEKARLRKADRRDEISLLIDDEVRYIDFDDLGELIYKQSSGYNNPDKIISKFLNLNSNDDFMNLKNELQSNYSKYFKENFQDKYFEQKWRDIIRIRNKVAHQGIFYKNELTYGLNTLASLTEIINNAERKIDEIVFSIEDKEAIRNATIEAALHNEINLEGLKILGKVELSDSEYKRYDKPDQKESYVDITEVELIAELEDVENHKFNRFVGIKWFVSEHLAALNYYIPSSYSMLNILIDKGRIEKYQFASYNGFMITAIKTVSSETN